MAGLPWCRLYVDFLDDPKIISLAFEDQRHFVSIMLLKSSGVLDQNCNPQVLDRIVAQKIWVDYSVIGEVKRRLIEADLIDSEWQPLAWEKRQMKSDHDTNGAERQKRYREKQKLNQGNEAVTETVTHNVTESNETVTLPDKIREDKIRKDILVKTSNEVVTHEEDLQTEKKQIPYSAIVDLYHKTLPELPQVFKLTEKRKSHIRQRWHNDLIDLDDWTKYFTAIRKSDFLMGRVKTDRNWRADFDFLILEKTVISVAEGKYRGQMERSRERVY